jgi:transposase
VKEFVVDHTGSGISGFLSWLTGLAPEDASTIALAIETPQGAMVESLAERGFAIFSINPKQVDRFRDRHTVAGAKDDRRDAFVLADSLRTDERCFHRVRLDDPLTIQLREWSRMEEDLRQDMNRTMNQFREQLHRYFPQLLKLSPGAEDGWLWDLIECAPTPARAARLTKSRIERIFKAHRIRRLTAEEVRLELQTPALQLAPGAADAASLHALMLLPRLRLLRQQQQHIAGEVERLLERLQEPEASEGQPVEHRDAEILLSCPGIGRIIAATMLAEASQAIRERDYHALRSYAGAAPVTKQSGKRRVVQMRKACNPRLRDAFYHWARVASMCEPRTHDHYVRLRRQGHTHGRALRGIADRLTEMSHRYWHEGERRNSNPLAA